MFDGLTRRVAGKLQAASSLSEFVRYMSNWRAVWRSYRAGQLISSPLQLRNGVRVEFSADDDVIQVFREVFVNCCYTPAWFYTPHSGDAVVDLGANIGAFSLAMANAGARCHAFEPSPGTRQRLLRNVAVNPLSGSIRVYPYGIAGRAETLTLKAGKSSIHSSLHASALVNESASQPIEVITLAEALRQTGETRIELLKVDIEGAEKETFENAAPEVLASVRRVALEFHDHFRTGARAAAERALTAAGMRILKVDATDGRGQCGILYAGRS
jgi:FkbM family methyltransferase